MMSVTIIPIIPIILTFIILNVVTLSVIKLSVAKLSVAKLSVIMLSVIMLSVIMVSLIMLNVFTLSVVMLSVEAPEPDWLQLDLSFSALQAKKYVLKWCMLLARRRDTLLAHFHLFYLY
jgi:hypothetical protein